MWTWLKRGLLHWLVRTDLDEPSLPVAPSRHSPDIMGDWEDDDWEAAAPAFKPATALEVTAASTDVTKGATILAATAEPDMSKFADEDQEEPEKEHQVVKPQVSAAAAWAHA